MRLRATLLVFAALLPAGCAGGGGTGHGVATVWVTRDRGARVLLHRTVPAGLTAMQGLDRVSDLQTRYAGRFVQAIDGVAGSLSRQRDWFVFVNGYELDRSAAEYRLHSGDVEWWDYRDWSGAARQPVAVGSFPEPFLHGFDGKTRPAVVLATPGLRSQGASLARRIHARLVVPPRRAPMGANVFLLSPLRASARERFYARLRPGATAPGDPVEFVVTAAPARVTAVVRSARHLYEGRS